MFPYQWIFATLTVLMVLAFIWWYWKSIYPPFQPSPPPLASLQGMPLELRNQVYELVASNTSLRVISGEKLVAAYQALHVKNYPKFERTGLKLYVGGTPMANIKVPVVDVTPLLPAAPARHPVNSVSRQPRAEFHLLVKHSAGSEHLSVLNNFDLKQMELIAASVRAFDSEALQSDPSTILAY